MQSSMYLLFCIDYSLDSVRRKIIPKKITAPLKCMDERATTTKHSLSPLQCPWCKQLVPRCVACPDAETESVNVRLY